MAASDVNLQLDGKELTITHPDKLYWPDEGLTKIKVIEYYRDMASIILPYLRDRPVTLRLSPKGINNDSFYRRNLPDNAPDWFRYCDYITATNAHKVKLPLIDNAAGLIWLVNLGCIELHLWGSCQNDLQNPDWMVFDLDPGDDTHFSDVLQAALALREYLTDKGLQGFAKTSGGKGVHVYVRSPDIDSFEAVRAWVKKAATELVEKYPDLIALPSKGTHKGKHVSIDYAQNSIGRNTVAPYSLRAQPGAPVSMPLTWDEVEKGKIKANDFTMLTVRERVQKMGDVFLPVLG